MSVLNPIKGIFPSAVNRVVAPAGKNGKLIILLYHRVLEKIDPLRLYDVEKTTFQWHMQLLSKYFNPLSLSEAVDRLENGNLPSRSVVVTFDDGYADNCDVALPILRCWGIPATVFVATDYLNGGIMWNDAVIESVRECKKDELDLSSIGLGKYPFSDVKSRCLAASDILVNVKYMSAQERANAVDYIVSKSQMKLPKNFMLTSDQLRLLRESGIDIGGHTCSHPILANISKEKAIHEIVTNKEILEGMVDQDVNHFAYPNGKSVIDYTADHVDIVRRAGYKVAVTTNWGAAKQSTGRYEMPRVCIWDKTPFKVMMRFAKAYFEA